ncbi:MAG: hypothetical protein HYY59_01900 [Candidatus Omnitrophica bacterium]|nr:hypothetical protein [Candidatus Omnitrophota bacterium]
MRKAASFIRKKCSEKEGQSSEWDKFFLSTLDKKASFYQDTFAGPLPLLFVNAFSEGELRSLLKVIIEEHSKEIRSRFPKTGRWKTLRTESPVKIVQNLSKGQCFQLVLLMDDCTIVRSLEYLIEDGVVKIPATEVRRQNVPQIGSGWYNVEWECSRFGFRCISKNENIAPARLKRLVLLLNREETQKRQLEWKLRHVPVEGLKGKLDAWIHEHDPREILREIILTTEDNMLRTFESLRYGWFTQPTASQEEDRLIDKILWKLGYDVRLFPPDQKIFWDRLEAIITRVKSRPIKEEADREAIRSVAANFFVSLEDVLDRSLSFISWALLCDHYAIPRFKYNQAEARKVMADRLNGRKLPSGEKLVLDPGGKNTLFPLIQGFQVLLEVCEEVLEGSKALRRSQAELPGYHGQTDLQLFPFLHKALILDLNTECREDILRRLRSVSSALESSQICNVRNRIEHKRPDFPNDREILEACGSVDKVVGELEETGVCPLIYFFDSHIVDPYGRQSVVLKNYRGRKTYLRRPSEYEVCGLPPIKEPQVLVPCLRVNDSSEPIRFLFEESSDYVRLWWGYPRRKARLPQVHT